MEIKKILFISTASNISGATLALLEIVDTLKDRSIESIVVTAERGELEKQLQKRGIRCYKARFASWLCFEKEKHSFRGKIKIFIKKILNVYSELVVYYVLLKEKPNIVHINTGISPVGINSSKKRHIPIVWHIRELPFIIWNRRPFNEKYEEECLKKVECLLVISDFVKKYYYSKSPNNIIKLYDGLDINKCIGLRDKDILSSPVIQLSLCGGNEGKGHEDAIVAVRGLIERGIKNIRLSFWGSFTPKYKEHLTKLICENNINDYINFEGVTSNMPEKWSETDIALICSSGEAFGRSTIEAMATGALVIGANSGATPELLANNRGILYNKDEKNDLELKIISSIKNKEKSREIAKRGEKYATDGRFDLENYVDNLITIYKKLINQ